MSAPEPFLFRHSTRRIIYAAGALASIGELVHTRRLRRIALVIDGFFRDSEVCERVRGLAQRNGAAFAAHAPPNREPDTDTVEDCRRFLAEFDPDCVLAIGGGSTMDTAKVARIMLSNPGDVAEAAGFDREFLPHPSLFVCMPTTAGTGSEVSEMAVVSLAGSDIKLRYRSQNMTAEVAVLDPELTVSAPPPVTSACGFDALTHAVEGFVSRLASPMTDPYTIDAVRRLARWLPVAYEEPENIAARGQCLLASTLAACAFNSTQLGLAHAIAAPLGALHHVAHGVANAFALPAVTAFNESLSGEEGRAAGRDTWLGVRGIGGCGIGGRGLRHRVAARTAGPRPWARRDPGHRGGAGSHRRRRPEERQHPHEPPRTDPRRRPRRRLRDARAAEGNTAGRTAAAFGRRSRARPPFLDPAGKRGCDIFNGRMTRGHRPVVSATLQDAGAATSRYCAIARFH